MAFSRDSVSTQYTIIEFIGEGAFGKVAKCQVNSTSELVAVKILKDTFLIDFGLAHPSSSITHGKWLQPMGYRYEGVSLNDFCGFVTNLCHY
uniref:Protein kinase domain-containing protein n=1 Tax=Gouania willdenowi TaxID=441366 RepID=A0A8C5EG72_GOUWI